MIPVKMHDQEALLGAKSAEQPDTCITPATSNEEGQRMTDSESTAPVEQSTQAAGLVAVVVDLVTPAFLKEIGPALQRLTLPHRIVVTAPVEQETAVAQMMSQLALEAQLVLSGIDSTPAQRLLEILTTLGEHDYAYFCRLVEPALMSLSEPAACPFEPLIGDTQLVEKVVSSFIETPSLAVLGCATDRVSMRSNTPPGLTKLSLLTPAAIGGQPTPWDWGYFASGCFWGRTSVFLPYLQLPRYGTQPEPPSHPKSINTWAQAFERMFGLVAHMAEGNLGLIDYPVNAQECSPVVRILDRNHDAGIRSLAVRQQARALQRRGLLERYLLLRESNLLDPLWYYRHHLPLTREWEDCLLHHLEHPHTFLSQAHQQGDVGYALDMQGMHLQSAPNEAVRLITVPYRFLSEVFLSDTPVTDPPRTQGIKVSVICPTYNHERYLRECLDSLLAQETDFDYEVLVGDDASTDGTTQILQEYAQLHPQRIVAVSRSANVGVVANTNDLLRRARGQYIALCEGDDFWTNPGKLQLQADHLDKHPRCAAHFHPVKVFEQADPGRFDVFPRDLPRQAFGSEHIVKQNFIPSSSVMYRQSKPLHDLFEDSLSNTAIPLDWLGHILASKHGELHMTPVAMSVYRMHPGGMWSQHLGKNLLKTWGLQYLEFHEQALHATASEHGSHWCREIVSLFGRLFHDAFVGGDPAELLKLVTGHRKAAALFFAKSKIDVQTQDIVDEASLVIAFKAAFRVSTIVMTYNSADYLQQALDSVLAQKGLFSHEIIISDDASCDRTLEICESLRDGPGVDIKLLTTTQRSGAIRNFRRAIAACSGKYVAICEGDDYWISPHKLSKQLAYMLSHPRASMCFNWLLFDHEDGTRIPHPSQGEISGQEIGFNELLAEPLTANLSCCFYRRETLDLPDSLYAAVNFGDWLLNLRASTLGPIGFLRDILSAYRIHDRSQWSSLSDARKEQFMAECYRSFVEVFPERAEQIAQFLPATAPQPSLPGELAMRNHPSLRFHLDRLACEAGFLYLDGWLAHNDIGSQKNEEKILFITMDNGAVVHSQRMDNIARPDVHLYHRKELSIPNLDFTWAGYKTTTLPLLADGNYRLAVGIRSSDGLVHVFLKPGLRVREGLLDA